MPCLSGLDVPEVVVTQSFQLLMHSSLLFESECYPYGFHVIKRRKSANWWHRFRRYCLVLARPRHDLFNGFGCA